MKVFAMFSFQYVQYVLQDGDLIGSYDYSTGRFSNMYGF
jgi:hypothetical protein